MRFIIIFLFFFIAGLINGQILPEKSVEKYSISGNITDNHGESLIGANIYVSELNVGTSSNNYGFYSLTLPKGIYNIVYSYIGFNTEKKQVIDSIKFEQNKNEPKVFDVLLYAQEPPEDNYYYWGLMKDQYPVTTSLDKLRFANDDLINGNYLSGLKVHAIEAAPGSRVTLIMASIPADYFNYCLSILKETKYSDNPFEPAPANPETNINGGALGFFHAYSETSMTRIVRSIN